MNDQCVYVYIYIPTYMCLDRDVHAAMRIYEIIVALSPSLSLYIKICM